MKSLLAHEWLAPTGGSENVFAELLSTFPDARAVCLWNDAPSRFPPSIDETWLARTPLRRSKALALPFLSRAWSSVDLSDIDRVVASSHAFAHHLATRAARSGIDAYAYIHTPARYLWSPEHDDRGRSVLARIGRRRLKHLDLANVDDRVHYAANSQFVSARIRDVWSCDSTVIFPPVDVERLQSASNWAEQLVADDRATYEQLPDEFILGASRLVDYKRLDLAIEVGDLLQLPVAIAGTGPDQSRLRKLADEKRTPMHFVGEVSDELLFALYEKALLFCFLPIEDFGIMPIEAMSLGTPALVNSFGGAREGVAITGGGIDVDPRTGPDTLRDAAHEAINLRGADFSLKTRNFSRANFRGRVRSWVDGPPAPAQGGG